MPMQKKIISENTSSIILKLYWFQREYFLKSNFVYLGSTHNWICVILYILKIAPSLSDNNAAIKFLQAIRPVLHPP